MFYDARLWDYVLENGLTELFELAALEGSL